VPDRFIFRFDRRLTVGESPDDAVADVDGMASVASAKEAGLSVDVSVPIYEEPTWKGYQPGNPQIYMGWATPEDHPAIQTAVNAYDRVVGPNVGATRDPGGGFNQHARVDRWIFSTDGVGFPVPESDNSIEHAAAKNWVVAGGYKHPPMFGFGPGIEQNTHKIGECVDQRELRHAISFLARFPSLFAEKA
jgi:acetylornithine deacetylase/succinyl-diaminopimelate desuccinylase-like protein